MKKKKKLCILHKKILNFFCALWDIKTHIHTRKHEIQFKGIVIEVKNNIYVFQKFQEKVTKKKKNYLNCENMMKNKNL